MKKICVVHLVRAQNGIAPCMRFLESYKQNPGGVEHDLLIVFKGFSHPQDAAEYQELLASFRHATLYISDEGFDITAYFTAAKRYWEQYHYFCFLNSFSVIHDREWLSKLYEQISRPGIGLVGATGSWQSHRGSGILWFLMAMSVAAIRDFRLHSNKPVWTKLALSARTGWQFGLYLRGYIQFPNYHLRTNAFMISSELMKKIKFQEIKSKTDTYSFESGIFGLTQQILKMGKAPLVVGKDGIGYEKERWNESMTFWQSEQENLLVSDNQTRDYQCGTTERRKYLSNAAWVGFTGWGVLNNNVRRFWRKHWKKSACSSK